MALFRLFTDRPALGRALVLGYVFVQPLGHNAALKPLLLVGMLTLLVAAWRKECWRPDWRSPLTVAMVLLVSVALLSATWSDWPWTSLKDWRKEFLPAPLLFFSISAFFTRPRQLTCLLVAYGAALGLRALVIAAEQAVLATSLSPEALDVLGHAGWSGLFASGLVESPPMFKGFGIDAALYGPWLLAAVWTTAGWRRIVLASLGVLAVAVLITYGSRTPMVAVVVFVILLLLLAQRWRALALSMGIGLVALTLTAMVQQGLVQRYLSIFSAGSYGQGTSMSERRTIWQGTKEISANRPLLGYGPGWKKLAVVAQSQGYVERWRAQEAPAGAAMAEYFSGKPSGVNPHSLWLQIWFETGALGLLTFAGLLVVMVWESWRLLRARVLYAGFPWAAFGLAYLCGYLILNLFNGLWLTGALLPALAGMSQGISRYAKVKEDGARAPAQSV